MKTDVATERASYLDIRHVIFIEQSRTSDFSLTKQIRDIVQGMGTDLGGREAAIEDLDAVLQDKNVPLDEVSRRQLAERLVDDMPEQGVLTISNALQWRLQYGRAISTAVSGSKVPEVVDLRA